MKLRPGPLKAAAALAVGFIAVRVVYRVLFHGADGDGIALVSLPALRLPPPLAHVVMFGPVTADGVWAAVVSALPIALMFLAFGLVNAVFDLSRIFARAARRGPFQGIGRALAIAWATLPALADAVRAVRYAQRLRGERAGIRLLAPVLERTLERATAVAAALEIRGYAGRGMSGDCAHPVEISGAALGHDDPLRVASLSLAPGTLTVLSGPTGSGKTTFLRALSGLLSHVDGGTVTGDVRVVGADRAATPPRDTARTVGVVLQHPREAFATESVAEEIGLALELRGVARVIRDARVREIAARVGITGLRDRPLRGLSAGEATLVAIGAAIVDHPILLLVDEPLADLDQAARARIVALLGALAHDAGMCVVVAEHRVAEFAAVADRSLRVADGTVSDADHIQSERTRMPDLGRESASIPADVLNTGQAAEIGAATLTARGITVRHGERVAVNGADVDLRPGEIVALTGPNGAGKSTLLQALALPGGDHDARIDGAPPAPRAIVLVPDASDDLFVRATVAAECRRADRYAQTSTAARFAALLRLDPAGADFAALCAQHPRDLSAGQRRALAITLQTASAPRVLLIDEPTRGLDAHARELVARALVAHAAAGAAVLIATHDAAFAASVASRTLTMDAGILTPLGPSVVEFDRAPETRIEERSHPLPPAVPPVAKPGLMGEIGTGARRRGRWRVPALIAANLVAVAAFVWPLAASAVPAQGQSAVPYIAIAVAPLAVILIFAALDASIRSAHTLALLAVLAAIGAAIRIASTGVGGVEALFVLLILAGRAFGPRFGLLLGAASIALSALLWGGIGPWLPFQMFACGWVGAGAGLLPRRVRGIPEIAMLSIYGILSSYLFGLIMNLWFWPFAVGGGTSISYVPGGPIGENLANFLVYSLLTSTASWDTLRAITTVVGLVTVGSALLRSLRRAKPVAPAARRAPSATSAPGIRETLEHASSTRTDAAEGPP